MSALKNRNTWQPHGLMKTKRHTYRLNERRSREQFINGVPAILVPPVNYLIIFTLNTEVYRQKWNRGTQSLFELPDNASPLAVHQSALGRIGAFHSFFQIGWPRLQPLTGCGKLEIKRLPFTHPAFHPLTTLLLLLRPSFPAQAIVWVACSPPSPRPRPRPPTPDRRPSWVLFSFQISC